MFTTLQTTQAALESRLQDSVPKLEVASITGELVSVQDTLREAENKQKEMERVIVAKGRENQELADSVDMLQYQVQTSANQIEQTNQELQSKRTALKHAEETVMELREKLEDCEVRCQSFEEVMQTTSDKNVQLETEVQKLSKQLQLLITEYRKLEQTVEENARYCQEAESELKRRDRVIEHLKHQAEEASADYKFRVSQLSAETEQLRRQRVMKSPRVEDSDLSLSRRSRG